MKKLKFISLLSLGAVLLLTSCGGGGNVKVEAEPKNLPAKQVGSLMILKVGSFLVKNKNQKDGQEWSM